jgi:transglutaminase-like putative cysteine protease
MIDREDSKAPMQSEILEPQLDPVDANALAGALASTALVDSDHPAVRAFAREHDRGANVRERALSLYHAVRDAYRYDPYRVDFSVEGMRASTVVAKGYGWCVPKAALLAAACRAVGIPARLGYADVRNHLATGRMRQFMQTDMFIWHGFTEVLIEGRWVKATPAFNIELTERFGLHPLEWDGIHDSIYHPYDREGRRHMEYVRQRGSFDDMPLATIVAEFETFYPAWLSSIGHIRQQDFLADVQREQG